MFKQSLVQEGVVRGRRDLLPLTLSEAEGLALIFEEGLRSSPSEKARVLVYARRFYSIAQAYAGLKVRRIGPQILSYYWGPCPQAPNIASQF